MTTNLVPDSKLSTPDELRARLQQILRARSAEQDRPARDRKGVARPDLFKKQADKLRKFEDRAEAIKQRLRARGEQPW